MTLTEYQAEHALTDAKLCRLLNESRPSGADPAIFEHRLKRLKDGRSRASQLELYVLQTATGDECCSYR